MPSSTRPSGYWFAESLNQRNHASPHRQRIVLFVVDRRASANFRRDFFERQRQNAGCLQIFFGRLLGMFPPAGDHVIGETPQRLPLLDEIGDGPRPADHHHRAIVDGSVERRARQNQSVDQRDG